MTKSSTNAVYVRTVQTERPRIIFPGFENGQKLREFEIQKQKQNLYLVQSAVNSLKRNNK